MSPVARLLALWLAALWLPLTLHCQLACVDDCDAVSICCGNHCGCSGGGDCQSDVCKSLETGNYIVKKDLLSVPAESCEPIGWLEFAACQRLLAPAVATLTEVTGSPPGWNRVWQFAFRAAPAPRAPSALC